MNKKELLLLSIGIFLTALSWLVADIYHAASEDKIKAKIEIPIIKNYQIDKNILDSLQLKNY
ncbi:hypothetical protein COW98_05000 [Candidatus Roizmanbacteria bacterium CG22_combo_CG10-13_8_21_14_all_35_9]|uniref:Uncharacterized protein n=4 Tax=Candidatus Roizmaniibacteriota TaxID=1752723 RepID=A0A2M8F4R4_9BACT|nr:MAG: hypothetical protein COX47_00900 [Candidatus Roizmanbacteria bacterium CG23_combo_of_CG06-09_8_20_14_all_35_49]PIP62269.1 MAG: hypothetical protein COW98_05000 [Candidatus Roizmanbacteria bacterium CG22_combo_CG10-13_8_21_14_all_35_9]PIY70866.1 MAG: hypothetical protein COY88_03465 [Candidatus Roizmanbacteria bacterium CG_4_10_14_0_8_um_filter_35_28]PJC34277.1 MAG: hypothetical protein CO048_00780 [Candidatus Roizmanbacteria bacterium CG_4_9_14_0_2_um_filter_35_15]PJC82841.1 MAG: hypoth